MQGTGCYFGSISPFYCGPTFYKPVPPMNYLNPDGGLDRQKTSVSNSTNSSHASGKSAFSKGALLLAQSYKALQSTEEKEQFLLDNASVLARD